MLAEVEFEHAFELVGVVWVAVSGPVALLVEAVGVVRDQVPAELPGAGALADLRVLLAQSEALRAVLLGRMADLEARQLFALDGASSTASWVQAQPGGAGREEVALARRLHRMPHVHAQVLAGQLSLPAAAAVGAALDKAARYLDRPDGLIGGHPGELVLANVIVDGVLQLSCEARGAWPTTTRP